MFSYLGKAQHLGAKEFMNLLDGLDLPEEGASHLAKCSDCRTTLTSITSLYRDISESTRVDTDDADAALANVDWLELRSSVRDRLLARAVKRASVLQRWTGWTLRPATAWSLALLTLVSGMTIGGWWHYRTVHLADEIAGISLTEGVDSSSRDSDLWFGLFPEDSEGFEAEVFAWSQTEIFTALNELAVGEEEVLRELIYTAFSENSIFAESMR